MRPHKLAERLARQVLHCDDLVSLQGLKGQGGLASALEKVVAALPGVPWAIAGGIAAGTWSRPIGTSDIDILVEDPDTASEALSESFGTKRKNISEALDYRDGWSVPTEKGKGAVMVDVIGISSRPGLEDVERDAIKNRKKMTIDGTDIYIMPPGHLLVSKIMVGRQRDLLHVTELVRAGHTDAARAVAARFLPPDETEDVMQEIALAESTFDVPMSGRRRPAT